MAESSTKLSGTSTSSKARNMPTVTTSATTSSTATWTTPSITPPSPSENPNIWQSNKPSGLVFIAVGSVVAVVFISVLVLFIVKKLVARRAAKHSFNLNFLNDFGDDYTNAGPSYRKSNESNKKLLNTFYTNASENRSSQNVSLLYANNNIMNNSLADLSNLNSRHNETMFSTLNENNNNKRRSMFISPTHEVMNMQKQQMYLKETEFSLINQDTQNEPNPSQFDSSDLDITDTTEKDPFDSEQNNSKAPEKKNSTHTKHKSTPSLFLDELMDD